LASSSYLKKRPSPIFAKGFFPLIVTVGHPFDILPGLKAEDSRIRLYNFSEPLQILFADAAEMFATSPIHGLMQTTWFFSR
jgi:hypothetical protein